MSKPSVYLETSVISYLTSRMSRDLVVAGHQQVTRAWWELHKGECAIFVSSVVIDEIGAGDPSESAKRLGLVRDTAEIIRSSTEAEELALRFIQAGALPQKATNDATHVAIAAIKGLDYLLTWNCKHIANARVSRVILRVCEEQGYSAPLMCTPLELIGGEL
jgi:predicted nucleic acid-binding protein